MGVLHLQHDKEESKSRTLHSETFIVMSVQRPNLCKTVFICPHVASQIYKYVRLVTVIAERSPLLCRNLEVSMLRSGLQPQVLTIKYILRYETNSIRYFKKVSVACRLRKIKFVKLSGQWKLADWLRLHLTAHNFYRNYVHSIALKAPKNLDPSMCCGCWDNCFQTAKKMTGFGLWGAEMGCMVSIGHTETNVRAHQK